jgi:hypothetical protein
MPMKPGTVIGKVPKAAVPDMNAPEPTPMERKVLEAAGWEPGQPLPDLTKTRVGQRLSQHVANIKQGAANVQGQTPVPPNTPPIEIPAMKDISTLPPAKQAEVYQTIEEMAELQQTLQSQQAQQVAAQAGAMPQEIAGVPGMAQAWQTAGAGGFPGGVAIVNDMDTPEGVTAPGIPPQPQPQPQPQPAMAEAAVEAPAPQPQPEGPVVCPRCGHDLNGELYVPDPGDKELYVQAVLGGQRIRKMHQLFGGRLTVVFHGLNPIETELAMAMVEEDVANQDLTSAMQYSTRFLDYRMTLAVSQIIRHGHDPIQLAPISDVVDDPAKLSESCRARRAWLHKNVYITDVIHRAVARAFDTFSAFQNYFEAKVEDDDFFAETEPSA